MGKAANLRMIRFLVIDRNYLGDVLLSSAAYVEILKHFPNAELLTSPEARELGERYFKRVHTSWKTVGRVDIAINLNTERNVNLRMLSRRIPLRIGYAYKRPGLSLQIANRCLNIGIPVDHQMFTKGYRLDEVCDLIEAVFGWKSERKMRW